MPRPLSDFEDSITSKLRYLEPELNADTNRMFTVQLLNCLLALHRAYQIELEVKHNSPKLCAHKALFDVLHVLSCRVTARFLIEQDRSQLQIQFQQVVQLALVNADQSLTTAHAALEAYLSSKMSAYFDFVLEQITLDNISISNVMQKLRYKIEDDVIENVPILCGYDIYSKFADNLKFGMARIEEYIEANASTEAIDDFVMEYTPFGYRINVESKLTTEPDLYIEWIANEIQRATAAMFNPATIMTSAPRIFGLAATHQRILSQPPEITYPRAVYDYLTRRHKMLRSVQREIDTLTLQQADTVIGEYMALHGIEPAARDALLSFGEGEIKRCVVLTIRSALEEQLKPYYAVADILMHPPTATQQVMKRSGPLP